MKCLLTGNNVKTLARAIHSLAKIGEELHIEPAEDGLVLKTVNSSKSAFASFKFHVPFFLCYSQISENTVQPSDPEEPSVVKCKLPMKSILSVFRSIGALEKSVETCKMTLPLLEALLIIEFKCKHGIVKHFNLRYFESESVEAEFSKEGFSSKFACSSRSYSEALQSFHVGIPEISWSLAADQVHLSNYIDDELDPSKCVRTEVTLAKEEFDEFNVALCTKVTFCLKELRAILSFAEPQNLDLHCRMEAAGDPVLFSLEKENLFSADFLLATLSASTSSSQRPTPGNPAKTAQSTTSRPSTSGSVLRNESQAGRGSISRGRLNSIGDESLAAVATTSGADTTMDHQGSRLNSLSLLEPHPILVPMGTDLEVDDLAIHPPPAKRARARFIFQRCLKSTQSESSSQLGEILAGDSDCEEMDIKKE